jgi:hypothetical protein
MNTSRKIDPSEVLVSPEDVDLLEYSLATNSKGYLLTGTRKFKERKIHKIVATRINLIGNINNKLQIDHINRNKLDNRRENLRLVNKEMNMNNVDFVLNGKGYCIHKKTNKYRVQIGMCGKKIFVGLFDTPEQARAAYVEAKNKRLTELGLTDLLLAQ